MDKELPLVSIIILNFNGVNDTIECLDSLLKLNYDNFEIIVYDNASVGNDCDILKEKYDNKIILIKSKRNVGFGNGNNNASNIAQGKYLWFLNNDTVVEKESLIELVKFMEENTEIGIAMPSEYSYYSRNKMLSNQQFYNRVGWRNKQFSDLQKDKVNKKLDKCIEISYVSGASMFFREHWFFRLGKFDNRMFAYNEDVDLSFRSWIYGRPLFLIPSSKIFHKISKTSSLMRSEWRIYETVKNALRSRLKNFQKRTLILSLIVFIIFNLKKSLEDILFNKNFNTTKFRVKAIIWNIVNLRDTLDWRNIIQKNRKFPDKRFLSLNQENN